MSDKIVLSIPHTGTRSAMKMFNCGQIYTYVRTFSDYSIYEEVLKKSFIIVPLKNPRKVWESWIDTFEQTGRTNPPIHLFSKQWGLLEQYSHEFPLWYLPVDKLLTESLKPVGNRFDYYNPQLYPQPYWDYIYNLPMVSYFYSLPDDLRPRVGRQFLALRAKKGGVGVELGVAAGDLTERIMNLNHFSKFYAVDSWADEFHPVEEYNATCERLRHYDKLEIVRSDAVEWLRQQPDESLDYVYIDCYAHTGQDDGKILEAAWPKLVQGGLFAGDDYNNYMYPQTYEAANRFAAQVGRELQVYTEHLGTVMNLGDERDANYDFSPSWYFYK